VTVGYLLDTNHLANAVRPSPVRRRIGDLRLRGIKIGTCVPVLCEVEAGAEQVSRPIEYRQQLGRVLRQIRLWPINPSTARLYGTIHQDLKRRGRAVSQVDIMLAALAREMNLTLVTTDLDFIALPDIRTENWLAAPFPSP
jgi:predicted nucleic acid-binding protein